jgi:hypothetical protein
MMVMGVVCSIMCSFRTDLSSFSHVPHLLLLFLGHPCKLMALVPSGRDGFHPRLTSTSLALVSVTTPTTSLVPTSSTSASLVASSFSILFTTPGRVILMYVASVVVIGNSR